MKRETEDAHIYFPKSVLNELRRWAKVNRRSLTAETVIAVEEYILRLRSEKPGASAGMSKNGRARERR